MADVPRKTLGLPARAAGTIVTDEGDGGVKIADYLSEQKFI